jgi:hypothetical protein
VLPSRSDPARTQHEIPGREMGGNSEVFIFFIFSGERRDQIASVQVLQKV